MKNRKKEWKGFEYATEEAMRREIELYSYLSLWAGAIFVIALVYHWCY
jgi:hypothetical protein